MLRIISTLVLAFAALWIISPAQTHAKVRPAGPKVSYLVGYSGHKKLSSATAPCSKQCPNGIRLSWSKGTCNTDDRYPPIAIVFSQSGKIDDTTWPLIVPCSTGVNLWWGKTDAINQADWIGADQPTEGGLAICFLKKIKCTAVHCATAGCIPASTNGFDVFLQGNGRLSSAQWLHGSKLVGTAKLNKTADNVFWYGHSVPASPFAVAKPTTASPPASLPASVDSLFGRTLDNLKPLSQLSSAPSKANEVDYAWFLPQKQSTPTRGCLKVGGATWATFPRAFAYTSGGQLASRVTVPRCPVVKGKPEPFNTISFGFKVAANGKRYVATSASAWDDLSSNGGCLPPTGGQPLASTTLLQPPSGTDGVLIGFPHDDFKGSCWSADNKDIGKAINQPFHVRLGAWKG